MAQKLLKISCLGQSSSQLVSPHRQMSVKSATADHADPPRNHVRWSRRDMELWEICPSISSPQADALAYPCPHPRPPSFLLHELLPYFLISPLSLYSPGYCSTAYDGQRELHVCPGGSFLVNMTDMLYGDTHRQKHGVTLVRGVASSVCLCLPCVSGQAMHVMMLAEGCTAAVPDQPFLPVARVAALWKKATTQTVSLKQNVAYAQLRKWHQTFLQSSALCGYSPWKPCKAKGFQTITYFHVETLQKSKETRRAMHIHTCRRLALLLLASVFQTKPWQRSQTICRIPFKRLFLKKQRW